jgi:hypothetical protein
MPRRAYNDTTLRAPFPWFGGKSRVAHLIWDRFGDVPNYVEPFFGSGAVMLMRPHPPRIETINDLDCYVANFWRSVQRAPDEVALYADSPVNEADLHARHLWLVNRDEFRERMKSDPDYFDAKIAGWWVWGISCWIGSGWCSRPEWTGRINASRAERGVHAFLEQRRPNLGSENGVHAKNGRAPTHKRPRITGYADAGVHAPPVRAGLADEEERNPRNAGLNIWQKRPALHRSNRGTNRQLPDIGGCLSAAGRGVHGSGRTVALIEWMENLSMRLRAVRVCCGDWTRVLGRSPTECIGVTGIFLDPPYGAERDSGIYSTDDLKVAAAVREYAVTHGDNPKLRIALCGYQGEHAMPADWTCLSWKANGGHGNAAQGRGRANAARERIWFSPHCLVPRQPELFNA